jgi:small subunit ribosomal protein S21
MGPRDSGMRAARRGNGLGITVIDNNIDIALKILKKKVKESKLLIDYKKKMEFEKPSEKRRKDRRAKIARSRKYQNYQR